jgi:hypothetical protein
MERIPRRTFLGVIPAGVIAAQGVANLWAAHESHASEAASHGLDLDRLAETHDLRLPDWGCYTKDYNGISHLANKRLGLRFDLSVFPGFFRRMVLVPNVNWESGYHPWDAATDLSYFSYRYELEWKDRVYCDVSFSMLSERARLVRAEFVNRTSACQNVVLHYMASMHYPRLSSFDQEPLRRAVVSLPSGGLWIDALDYRELEFAHPRPSDSLVYDAQRRAEIRAHDFVGGSGIGQGFGKNLGDKVAYNIVIPHRVDRAILLLRYRKLPGAAKFRLGGVASGEIVLDAGEGFAMAPVELGQLAAGSCQLSLESIGRNAAELDGLAIVEADRREGVRFSLAPFEFTPRITQGPVPNSRLLKYPDSDNSYGIAWDFEDAQVRELQSSELDRFLRHQVHDHIHSVLVGDRKGHFTNVFMRPIPLQPRTSRVIYGIVACGSESQIAEEIRPLRLGNEALHRSYLASKEKTVKISSNPAGELYRFSQERMAATVLTNVVYPVYMKRGFIRHFTPGKWWDSLYTWDSGFIGLGLAELNLDRAIDCLNAYTTKPGDVETAFVHHGTPVPVQMYLFQELWNRTQSRALLAYFYPRLRQYHLFLAGRLGTSTTRKFKSGMLCTWDYFYNSGGWDDYPPQVFVHAKKLEGRVAPVANTAHAIRTARILRWVAESLGATTDLSVYDEDIEAWTQALHKHAWDSESGYFSYVIHDDRGLPVDVLRHESGRNFNMGMDGVAPLIAGACSPDQTQRLLGHLQAGQELWTPIGLTTVDQSAPYYRKDGYWNGAVWFPHQWFIWKTLLDLGEAERAFTIADTALNVWKNEVNETYHCFEHFLVASRRGAGWHQFSALTSPILAWFAAYYRPGRLTTGFDAWISHQEFSPDATSLKAEIHLTGQRNGSAVALATMNPAKKYCARWQGKPVPTTEASSGTVQVQLPANAGLGTLSIEAT